MSKSAAVLTVGVDFGTTYSGYAYSFAGSNGQILINTNWSANSGLSTYKAPTSILTRYDSSTDKHTFLKFGFSALDEYVRHSQDGSYCLFDTFKMKLYKIEEQGKSCVMKIKDKRGTTSADASTIFTMSLKYIKDHLMSHIKESGSTTISMDLVRWVLTVPAIWDASAKGFMRKAAKEAGLISTVESENLLFALEPEAASLYCRGLPLDNFSQGGNQCKDLTMPTGTVYMIIDAGGGTVDITVHEVLEDGNVKEVVAASGGAAGGTNVDATFTELLSELWGMEFTTFLQEECSSLWLNLEQAFENAKRKASPSDSHNYNLFLLSGLLIQKYQKEKRESIFDCFKKGENLGLIYNESEGTLALNSDVMDKMFRPTVENIVKFVDTVIKNGKTSGLNYIFMVGGFSTSSYLKSALTKEFGGSRHVLTPEDPALAVVKGAVQFGLRPDSITSRIARKSYGVGVWDLFDPSKHKIEKQVTIDGVLRCENIFHTIIEKNSSVELDSCIRKVHHPSKNQTNVYFGFCASELDNVVYTDDVDTREIGSITLHSPDTSKGSDRAFDVAYYFGGTDIKITAKERNVPGAVEKTTTIAFTAG